MFACMHVCMCLCMHILFNDALIIFYLRLYGVIYIVNDYLDMYR